MGRGSSKIGGSGGGAMVGGQQTDEQKFITNMVESITRTIGPDDIPMSRSDLESAVEAYAMTHPGVDEDALIDKIDSAVDAHDNAGKTVQQAVATAMRSTSPSVPLRAPADFSPTIISPARVTADMRSKGFEHVGRSDLANTPVGTPVVVSSPVMKSALSNRRDPDAVHFEAGTFAGLSRDAFKQPVVQLNSGRRIRVDIDMPYESVYRRK